MESARGSFSELYNYKVYLGLKKVNNSHNCHGLKRVLKARSVMEWKGCHFENRSLALGVVSAE